jgi:O-antigen ligase
LLACAFPVLAAWACSRSDNPGADLARRWLAGLAGALIVPLIIVTGSRSGVPLAAIGLAAASLIFWFARPANGGGGKAALLALAPWLVGFALLFVSLFVSRAAAIERFFQLSLGEDLRVSNFGTFVDMAKDFFPFGSGFGTFDPAYRIYEPANQLSLEYLNHAHNDLMELLITAGLFGGGLLLAFLVWLFRKSWLVFRERRSSGASLRILGLAVVVILLAASVLDYPLRTPLMMAMFAIGATWLGAGGLPRQSGGSRRPGGKALLRPDESLSTARRQPPA